jgi:hypothetical protein
MIGKIFPIREQMRLQFRSEYFNMFNRVNLANPIGDVDNGAFGKANSTVTGPQDFAIRLETPVLRAAVSPNQKKRIR